MFYRYIVLFWDQVKMIMCAMVFIFYKYVIRLFETFFRQGDFIKRINMANNFFLSTIIIILWVMIILYQIREIDINFYTFWKRTVFRSRVYEIVTPSLTPPDSIIFATSALTHILWFHLSLLDRLANSN